MTEKMTNEELAKRLEIMNPLDMDDALIDEACRRLRAMLWRPIEKVTPPDGPHFRGLHVQRRGRDGSVLYTYWDAFYGYVEDETDEFVTVDGGDCGWSVGDFTHWCAAPQTPEPAK